MSFYLLKSTNDRSNVGDVLLNKSEISNIMLTKRESTEESYFLICVSMKNGDDLKGCFNTEEEAKIVIAELMSYTPVEIINEMIPQTFSTQQKEEALKKMKGILFN